MSADIQIHQLHAGHRAPDDAGLQRCCAAQAVLLDGELEAALAGCAGDDEVVVLRRLDARLSLNPQRTDRHNARAWADALAMRLADALLHAPSTELLRFARRRDALHTFAVDMIDGVTARDWGWQRLDLLPAGAGRAVTDRARRDALLALLADDADVGVPLLRGLLPTRAWPVLVAKLDDVELRGLATTVLARITDTPANGFAAALPAVDERKDEDSGQPPALPPFARPTWLVATSPVGRVAALRLAAMLADPALARRGAAAVDARVAGLVAALAATLGATTAPTARGPAASSQTDPAVRDRARSRGGPKRRTDDDGDRATERPAIDSAAGVDDPDRAAAPANALPMPAATGDSHFGGLLLLLPLLPACGALALLEDPSTWPADRPENPPALALHRLALALLPLAPDDPAALAFCGRAPGDAAPGALAGSRAGRLPPLPPAQEAAVAQAVERLTTALAQRLPGWRVPGLVDRVARRPARITVEPGWIDVEFALADVCLDLRRAGLDLDPGFLPWLGAVMKLRYA